MQRRIAVSLSTLGPFLPYIVISAVHIGALAVTSSLAPATKMLLMPLLALPVVLNWRRIPPRSAGVLVLIALFFSWLGDEAGAFFPAAPELPLMLGFFGIAHIAYITLFLRTLHIRRMPLWTIIYALWWLLMFIVLVPHTGPLVIGVALYGIVLAGTAATAARCHPLVTWGGAFFLTSDTLLAFRLFLPEMMPSWTGPTVMITYTLGQGLIIAGALKTLRKTAPRKTPTNEKAMA